MQSGVFLPLLNFKNFNELAFGPIVFHKGKEMDGIYCHIETTIPDHEKEALLLQSLYLLYFSANAHKIYNGEKRDPIGSYFKTSPSSHKMKVDLHKEDLDPDLYTALVKLISDKEEKERETKRRVIQAIYYLLERDFGHHEHWDTPLWNHYLLLGLSFEVLYHLNPISPQSDLRHYLRPLLHLQFSRPVELLWKWVDLFYAARNAYLLGKHPAQSNFIENDNVKSPLYLIGEKLLIFSIYDLLFYRHLLPGSPGTAKTPDNFSKIHPDRVLVYFWPLELIDKKITLTSAQSSDDDLAMLYSLKTMHKKLQGESLPGHPELFF